MKARWEPRWESNLCLREPQPKTQRSLVSQSMPIHCRSGS